MEPEMKALQTTCGFERGLNRHEGEHASEHSFQEHLNAFWVRALGSGWQAVDRLDYIHVYEARRLRMIPLQRHPIPTLTNIGKEPRLSA